jgi:hypothetical protein
MSANESVSPCEIERAARAWEAQAKHLLVNYPRKASRGHRLWADQQIMYARGCAAGLREALSILGREE